MNKIKSHYNLRKFDLPESFNQSDVMVGVPFEYGQINIFPYYDTVEVIEYNSNKIPSLFVIFKCGIEELAIKILDSLTRDDLLYMNLHMLSKKLFNTIDYREIKKEHFTLVEKEKTGYKGIKGPTGRYEEIPVYEVVNKSISKIEYYKLKRNGKAVQKILLKHL